MLKSGPRIKRPTRQLLPLLALTMTALSGRGQSLHYVDAHLPGCSSPAPAGGAAKPRAVVRGAAVAGSLRVACGFEQGSYTVTLGSSDPDASIVPRSFIVNFGRLVGKPVFMVRFATLGPQTVSAAITSNMGSPALTGRFVCTDNTFEVLER